MQVDVYTSAGVRAGSGPITTATNWKQVKRLDRLGEFSFQCASTDPQVAQLIAKREVRCIVEGQTVGHGIIDRVENNGEGMLSISGLDIGAELRWRIVGEMDMSTDGWSTSIGVSTVRINEMGNGQNAWLGTKAFDGNTATYPSSNGTTGMDMVDNDRWMYIGGAVPFSKIRTWSSIAASGYGGGTWGYGHWSGNQLQFYTGTLWIPATKTSDTTVAGTNSFGQNGTIEFSTGGTAMQMTTEFGMAGYFLRGRFQAPADRILMYEVQTWGRVPTGTALAQLATAFPAGWSLDTSKGGSTTDGTAVYGKLCGETVLEALGKLSDWTGEHWYLDSDRHVVWIGLAGSASGIRAIAPLQPGDSPGSDVCYINSIRYNAESYDTITRVYPYGGGLGDGKLTLEYSNRTGGTIPGGTQAYVVSSDANGYFVRLEPEPSPQIDASIGFKDITANTSDQPARQNASNALLDVAVTHLGRNSTAKVSYGLSVTNLTGTVNPGDTIRVDYRQYTDGAATFSVNQDLVVLETTTQIDAGGPVITDLTVSTVYEWVKTQDELLAQMAKAAKDMGRYQQPVGVADVRTPTFEVSASPLTVGGGGLVWSSLYGNLGYPGANGAEPLDALYYTPNGVTLSVAGGTVVIDSNGVTLTPEVTDSYSATTALGSRINWGTIKYVGASDNTTGVYSSLNVVNESGCTFDNVTLRAGPTTGGALTYSQMLLDSTYGVQFKFTSTDAYLQLLHGSTTKAKWDASGLLTAGGIQLAGSISPAGANTAGSGTILLPSGGALAMGTAAGRIVFTDAATDALSVMSAYLGVGTLSPAFPVHVAGDGAAAQLVVDSYANGTNMRALANFRAATGSLASPGDVAFGGTIGEVVGAGWAGGAFRNVWSIRGEVQASGTITASSLPTDIVFQTTLNNSVTRAERMRLSGGLGVGYTSPVSAGNIVANAAMSSVGGTYYFVDTSHYLYKDADGSLHYKGGTVDTHLANASS